mmetsp:Transcript_7656/g.15599  ORF Transcript_7656/g.15599 Transcript_7656/m.15599 type:complete len:1368 (-) Transcript_7656:213-4316(-)
MIRRMVDNKNSLPHRQDDGKELDSSNASSDKNMDRSIHSIEEGTEKEEEDRQTAADYNSLQIPPFRGNGHANRRPPIRDGDMDDSSHSASSLGHQSIFIQQRIDRHKKEGKWKHIALDDSTSSDDGNPDDVKNNTDAAVKDDEYPDSNEQPSRPGAMPRTPSLVCLLKMEPISESMAESDMNDKDDDGTSIVSPGSYKSEVSVMSDNQGFEIGDLDPPIVDGETSRRRSSFLPNVDAEPRFVEVEITPMVEANRVKSHDGDHDSETFMFTSINSADHMTHASDAPDYDYNSEHGEQTNSRNNEERIPPAASAPYRQKFISPMDRKRSFQERAQNTARDEVCEVLGLPKDNPRRVHRGIMSRATETRLRNLIGDESDSDLHAQEMKNESSASKLPWKEETESSSVDSDDSSMDLAFGDSPGKKSRENDKWERLRHERRMSRQSSTSSATRKPETSSAHTNGTSAAQAKESNEIEEHSWHNSFHWIKNPLHYVNNNDDDGASLIGKFYNRFQKTHQQTQNEDADHDSTSDCESSYDSGSDDSSDDEDNAWEMNIMTEGQYYLSMSMLVYVYGLLRQTSLLGHTEITFDEVDVNSSQAEARMNKSHRYLNNTKSAGFIIRVVMDELEKKGAFSDVEKEEGDMSVLRDFKQWVHDSRCDQLDSATADIIRDLRRKVARKRWKRAIHAVRLAVRLGKGNKKVDMRLVAQQSFRRIKRSSVDRLKENMTDSLKNLKNAGTMRAAKGSRALASSMVWMHDQRAKIMDGLGLSEEKQNSLVDQSDVRDIVDDAFEQPRFFKEGSLMSNLIESSIEVVWFSDRHPNDVVYSICCNRRQKRVSVVFRGTVNSHNWLMNLKFFMTKHPNPIAENYPGREETLGFHTGYSLYMTRQRKDDSLTKIEEIFSKIDSVGRELDADGDYNLSITGHSLGGALATILSFYAATNQMFSKVRTIRVFTYAAPRVGCYGFARAFQHLERKGKIRMARFSNTCDIIPLIPFHSMDRMGRSYKHVGMHIRLLGISRISQYWLRQALDVTYPKDDGWWTLLQRSFWASLFMNLNSPAGYKQTHKLSDYQKRIRFTLEFRNALAQTDLLHDKKRARLKTLEEYYFIRGGTSLTGTKELTAITIEESAKLADRRRMKKIVLGLLIIAIAEALLLLRFLNVSIHCESLPLILYPLYPLIGCQSQKSNNHSNPSTSSLEEREVLSPQPDVVTRPITSLHGNMTQTAKAKHESKLLSFRWPRVLSFSKRKAVSPTMAKSPCFWGRCIINPHSRLPWGVRLEHLPMPSDFEYQISEELALVSEQLVSDVHSFVIESDDIQSNISDTALKTLKAAEDNLQAVEYYETTRIDNISFLSNGLKYLVRIIIDFLERMVL